MTIDTLKRAAMLILLCLAQALVFNHIHLFDCATPLLYVYFALVLPRNYPKWAALLWCFALGLAVDVFSNTPGLAAGSMTLIAMLQPYLLELFVPRDAVENLKCSARTLGAGKFFALAFMLTLVYCLVYFSLELFSFFDWKQLLMNIGGSLVITLILMMTLDSVRQP
ncbi:MAG: rod shape-determining protein MreD [Prevotella sp.]|nr:rod shape-determining protein MreD [Prevotella sp.]